jgi:hypothetical protein
MMKPMRCLLVVFLICLTGCSPNDSASKKEQTMKVKAFTESDACKALLKDLKIAVDSPLGKALLAECGYLLKSGKWAFNSPESEINSPFISCGAPVFGLTPRTILKVFSLRRARLRVLKISQGNILT